MLVRWVPLTSNGHPVGKLANLWWMTVDLLDLEELVMVISLYEKRCTLKASFTVD